MKFENKGKWIKEAEDKLAAYDTQEHPDYLDGDNKVCTFEDDEVANFEEDDLDIVEEDDTLDSPEEEEDAIAMSESAQKNEMNYKTTSDYTKAAKQAIDIINKFIADEKETARLQGYDNADMKMVNAKIDRLKSAIKDLEFYKFESSQKNEAKMPSNLEDELENFLWKEVDYQFGTPESIANAMMKFRLKPNKSKVLAYIKKYWEGPEWNDEMVFRNAMAVGLGYDVDKRYINKQESAQKNEGSNWEYSVSVLDNYGDIQYSTDCKSQSDIDNAIKKYKARSVELRNADNCTTIEVTKDLVDDDGNILKSQSIKKISL